MPARERPCLEHVQRCPGLLVAFSLSLVSFKTGTFTPAARVLSWSSNSPDPLLVPNNDKPKLSTSAKLGFPFSANTPPAQTGGRQQKTKLRTSAAPGARPGSPRQSNIHGNFCPAGVVIPDGLFTWRFYK